MNNFFRLSAACFTLSFSLFSMAENQSVLTTPRRTETSEEMRPHFGVRAGLANLSDDYDTAFEYGLDVGFQPFIPFGIALEVSRFVSQSDQPSEKRLDRTNFLTKGTYNFGGNIPIVRNSYVGATLGPVFDNYDGVTYVRLGTGLTLGADIPLTTAAPKDSFSVGANIAYLLVTDTSSDVLGVSGIIKYWY